MENEVKTSPAEPTDESIDHAEKTLWAIGGRLSKKLAKSWAGIMGGLLFVAGVGAWGQAHITASANAHADAGDKAVEQKVDQLSVDVKNMDTKVETMLRILTHQ